MFLISVNDQLIEALCYIFPFWLKLFWLLLVAENEQIPTTTMDIPEIPEQNEPRYKKTCFAICEQQRRRSPCASAQSDQHLCC